MSLKNITILYVEDEDEIRENTKRPIKYLCDNLLVASNGEDGLKLYKEHHADIDIVISDIKMPKINGIEMCRAIKEIDNNQHIVFTTAYSESNYFIDAIEMQVDGYILKPIDYNLLENKIKSIKRQIDATLQLKRQKILINEIVKLQDNLLIVLDRNQEIVFSNENFLKFFKVEDLKQFKDRYGNIDKVILKDSSCFLNYEKNEQDLQDLDSFLNNKNKKMILTMINRSTNKPQTFLSSLRTVEGTLHTIIIFTEITNIAIEKDRYKYKAFTDELTGLYNRAFFNEVIKREINLFQREGAEFCLIMLDIDFFKKVNDTYGHQMGDEILKKLSMIVKKHIRESDIFARWGGEEFVIILPKTSKKDAEKVAQSLREVIKNHTFQNNLKITCSFGLSSFRKNDTRDLIIKRADEALYRAKKNGRNRVEVL